MAGVPFSKPRSQKRERSFLASTVHTASGGEPPGPGRAPPCSVFLGGSSCRPQAEWQTTARTCRPTPAAPRENIVAATQRSDRRAGLTLSTRGACGQRRSKGDEHADRAVLLGSRLVSTAEGARAVSASTCRASALPLLWERRWHRAGKPVASGGCSPKPLPGRRCPSFAAPHAASGSISGPV